jgi:hypothetical protein
VFFGKNASHSSRIDALFYQIDAHFNKIYAHFCKIDAHFSRIDAHFGKIDAYFSKIDAYFSKKKHLSAKSGHFAKKMMHFFCNRIAFGNKSGGSRVKGPDCKGMETAGGRKGITGGNVAAPIGTISSNGGAP